MLLLGEHAASPEVANTFEAKRAGAPATVEAVVRDARGSVPAETCTGFDAGSVACLSDAVRSERAAWIRTLHSAGVRLLLSGAPLGALTSQLCAEYGICAVAGVHNDDLRAPAERQAALHFNFGRVPPSSRSSYSPARALSSAVAPMSQAQSAESPLCV